MLWFEVSAGEIWVHGLQRRLLVSEHSCIQLMLHMVCVSDVTLPALNAAVTPAAAGVHFCTNASRLIAVCSCSILVMVAVLHAHTAAAAAAGLHSTQVHQGWCAAVTRQHP
jgi:hypothetical protein